MYGVRLFVRLSFRLSVCPIIWPQQRRAAGLLLSAVRAGDIDRQRRCSTAPQHGAQQSMRVVSCWQSS